MGTLPKEKIARKRKNTMRSNLHYTIGFWLALFVTLFFVFTRTPSYPYCFERTDSLYIFTQYLRYVPTQLEIIPSGRNHYHIYVLDGTGERFCEFSSRRQDIIPSPNGEYIAMTIHVEGLGADVVVSSMDGKTVHLSENLQHGSFAPIWFPDSSLIAFRHGGIGHRIAIMSPDGVLHNDFEFNGGVPYRWDDPRSSWGVWSPDGAWLTFSVGTGPGNDGDVGIYLINQNGENLERITFGQPNDMHRIPEWSEAGDTLTYFGGGQLIIGEGYQFNERCVIELATRLNKCRFIDPVQP